MLKIDAPRFVQLISLIGQLDGMLQNTFADPQFHAHQSIDMTIDGTGQEYLDLLDPVLGELSSMKLRFSHVMALRLRNRFTSSNTSMGAIQQDVASLRARIHDELEGQSLLRIDPDRAKYFENADLFGKLVFDNLPTANQEATEAGTCLALDRGTACVFHLGRALESALKVLARDLGITQQNDWGRYLKEIEEELQKRMKISGARSPLEQFYAEAHVIFDALRRAWRNPTMHVDQNYTPLRSEEILASVGSFIKHLATHLHE